MKTYILLHPDEDGNPVTFLENSEVEDIKELMKDYGIHTWIESFEGRTDPQTWDEEEAMLLEVELKVPRPIKVVEKYEL